MRRSADQGTPNAQAALGLLHVIGKGVVKDDLEALKLIQLSAKNNSVLGQFLLGVLYDQVDDSSWFAIGGEGDKKLFSLEDSEVLNKFFFQSKYVEKDPQEAITWYQRAADQNAPMAQAALGEIYEVGRGAKQDMAQAAKWYQSAAQMGFSHAQFKLGQFYREGSGVLKDYAEAYKWLNLAAAKGDLDAKNQREKLAEKMTPDQIAQGQQRASSFVPKSFK